MEDQLEGTNWTAVKSALGAHLAVPAGGGCTGAAAEPCHESPDPDRIHNRSSRCSSIEAARGAGIGRLVERVEWLAEVVVSGRGGSLKAPLVFLERSKESVKGGPSLQVESSAHQPARRALILRPKAAGLKY